MVAAAAAIDASNGWWVSRPVVLSPDGTWTAKLKRSTLPKGATGVDFEACPAADRRRNLQWFGLGDGHRLHLPAAQGRRRGLPQHVQPPALGQRMQVSRGMGYRRRDTARCWRRSGGRRRSRSGSRTRSRAVGCWRLARRQRPARASRATGCRTPRRRPRWQDGDFVFTTTTGTPLDSRNVTRALQAALARAGLPRQRFHDLRHACATLMLEDGEELAVISRSLGHANLSTTADVYAHLTPAMLERSAAKDGRDP